MHPGIHACTWDVPVSTVSILRLSRTCQAFHEARTPHCRQRRTAGAVPAGEGRRGRRRGPGQGRLCTSSRGTSRRPRRPRRRPLPRPRTRRGRRRSGHFIMLENRITRNIRPRKATSLLREVPERACDGADCAHDCRLLPRSLRHCRCCCIRTNDGSPPLRRGRRARREQSSSAFLFQGP